MSLVSILRQADIFDELTNTQMELVGSICQERHYQSEDIIFHENTPGNEMYVIGSRNFSVSR
jgi:CRP-like cAMP-binding protein